ncbi:winged helix-turn-helix domain-containing protein [Rubrivirga sp. IMCC43871]|uniref:winged helix-turn-helix domain-containing protein n=1 Tax=Rubrivirga sp. IMCC43871 TaxID=3391575 RepID=UPI00399005EE
MTPPPDWTFSIGELTVVPHANEVRQPNGTTVRLEPKATAVLVMLAAHPGEVVTREALVETVWPDVVVTEASLTRCVSQLRLALGDDAREPTFIETIPRVGYRLLVSPDDAEATPAPAAARRVVLVAAIALLALGGAIAAALLAAPVASDTGLTVDYRVEVDGTMEQASVTTTGADSGRVTDTVTTFPFTRTVEMGDRAEGTFRVRVRGQATDAEVRVSVAVRRGDRVLTRHEATATVSGESPEAVDVFALATVSE